MHTDTDLRHHTGRTWNEETERPLAGRDAAERVGLLADMTTVHFALNSTSGLDDLS